MSFFKVTGGTTSAGVGVEFLANTNREQIVQVSNLGNISGPIANSVAQNTAFVGSHNDLVTKDDFYVFELVIPDDATNNYFLEVFIGTQAELSVELLETVTSVANTTGVTFINRNRNSGATTSATLAQVSQTADPVTGGVVIVDQYIPRDQQSRIELGQLIVGNNDSYALRLQNLSKSDRQVAVRFDLYVEPV